MKRPQSPRVALCALVLSLAAATAMLVSPAASGQSARRVAEDLGRSLESFDQLSLDPSEVLRGARASGRVTLQTSRGTLDLDVVPFDVRAENYHAVAAGEGGRMTELPRTPSRAWRGTVGGDERTHVRLVLDEQKFEGIVVTPDETFFVEPARDLSAAAGPKEFVFYAASSVKQRGGECGTTLAGKVGAESPIAGDKTATAATIAGIEPASAFAPETRADMATEADFEFFQVNGNSESATNADILDILTQVDAIYDQQLGIRLRVTFQRVWTTANDPYTLNDPNSALNELVLTYDNTFQTPPARNLTHMFTGKTWQGSSIIGIAYPGVVCDNPSQSYGISRSRFTTSNSLRVALTAHEIGHNFGASHPNQESIVPPDCSPSIMNSFVQSTTSFCQFSRDQMTNHVAGTGGSCLTRLVQPGCQYALTNPAQYFATAGGPGSALILTTGTSCAWAVAEGADWIDSNSTGAGTGTFTFTVAPNTNSGPRQAALDIAGQKLMVRQAASPTCTAAQMLPGQSVTGALATSDCRSGQPERNNAALDLYTFNARAGQRVKIEMLAAVKASDFDEPNQTPPDEALDTFVYLFGPDGSIVATNDDRSSSPHNTDSSVPVTGFLTLPSTGVYTIGATSFSGGDNGNYTLKFTDNSSDNNVSLSSSTYTVDEGVGGAGLGTDGLGLRVINVTRTGDTSGTATVDYATSDGTASHQKDYTQALGTLVFAPGETSKSFTIFVADDAFQESPETLQVTLSNPVGTTLGATTSATLNINSANDAASGPSPVRAASFNTPFFVRQQYLDFFSREPDPSGFNFWQNEINQCGSNTQCAEVKRINVSAAFFLSIEFQETGYYVYRMYKAAYGDSTSPNVAGTVPVVRLNEFLPDTQRIGQGIVVGQVSWQELLESNKNTFAREFVLRPRFVSAYPLSLTPAEFVDHLNQTAGLVLTQGERDQSVADLTASPDVASARATVLRNVAENATLRQRELNRAFVLMQYYGYLRRNPDDLPDADFRGWKFWLDKLNQFGGNFVAAEMVKAFITSDEYVDRFGNRQ
jgi:hypothetical protein